MSAAFFDSTLERLLRAHFSSRTKKQARLIEPLFEMFGPLSTFSSKIRVSYAIDLIPEWIASDLDLVRRIRNERSHSLESRTFQDLDIGGLIDQFMALTKIAAGGGGIAVHLAKVPPANQGRWKFVQATSRIAGQLQATVVVHHSDAPESLKRNFMISSEL